MCWSLAALAAVAGLVAALAMTAPLTIHSESQLLSAITAAVRTDGAAAGQAPAQIIVLEPFVISLTDGRYLRLKVGLEVGDPRATAAVRRRLPSVRDRLMVTVSSYDRERLRTPEGKFQLREEIARDLTLVVPDAPIRTAYFLEFLIHS